MNKNSGSASVIIYEIVRHIPAGRVATYGQVAELAGNRKMARAVGNALHRNPEPGIIPCHRVVNSQGKLAEKFAFGGAAAQAELLEKEGVAVVNGHVDLQKYQMKTGVIYDSIYRCMCKKGIPHQKTCG